MKTLKAFVLLFTGLSLSANAQSQGEQVLINDLQKAYQKEILFLNSYKDEIEKKMKGLDSQTAARVSQARREIKSLEDKYLKIQTQNELNQKRLSDLESESLEKVDSQQALQGVIEQASMRFGKSVFEDMPLERQLEKAFELSLNNLRASDDVKSEEGQFFDLKGEALQGELISVGSISRFALTPSGAYSLFPAA